MIKIFDDVLPVPIFEDIQHTSIAYDFPWYMGVDIDYDKKTDKAYTGVHFNENTIPTFQFVHTLYRKKEKEPNISTLSKKFNKPIINFLEKNNIFGTLYQSKLNLLTNFHRIKNNKQHNIPHVDLDNPHYSILFYINDSDGDTIFFKEKITNKRPESVTEIKRVSPKANRLVISDGEFHTSTNPINSDFRIVYNAIILKNNE